MDPCVLARLCAQCRRRCPVRRLRCRVRRLHRRWELGYARRRHRRWELSHVQQLRDLGHVRRLHLTLQWGRARRRHHRLDLEKGFRRHRRLDLGKGLRRHLRCKADLGWHKHGMNIKMRRFALRCPDRPLHQLSPADRSRVQSTSEDRLRKRRCRKMRRRPCQVTWRLRKRSGGSWDLMGFDLLCWMRRLWISIIGSSFSRTMAVCRSRIRTSRRYRSGSHDQCWRLLSLIWSWQRRPDAWSSLTKNCW